ASGRDSKIVRGFASSGVCFSLGLSLSTYYALTSFGKGISLRFELLALSLTVERTVIGRRPSQCCQMYNNYPPNTIIFSLHVKKMSKRCRWGGGRVYSMPPHPRRSVLFFTNSNLVTLSLHSYIKILNVIISSESSLTEN